MSGAWGDFASTASSSDRFSSRITTSRRSPADPVSTGRGGEAPTDNSTASVDPEVAKLQEADRMVRRHEAAHASAAGGLALGGASFDYQQGPDGKVYAVGGEVRLDVSAGRTPEETIAKARQIRAAALAPSNPSPQDLAVASRAAAMERAAMQALEKMGRG